MMPVNPTTCASTLPKSSATTQNERIAKEARVNYTKLVTIEYNVKVLFIGELAEDDKGRLQDAVTECWTVKRRGSGLMG